MNPLQITNQLQRSLVDYFTTTFDVNRDGKNEDLAAALRDAFSAPGVLFSGPFLEFAPPYLTGKSLQELVEDGVLSSRLLSLDCFRKGKPIPIDAPLYLHQEAAIRKIASEERGVVISSGTGSGKTESFLIPVLDDLLEDPTPGVRAVFIYPLNALVNDQLDRLRGLLSGTNITFGRYTSELPETIKDARARTPPEGYLPNEVISREQIRSGAMLPQILITNYAMLEYLLLRPEDSPLFTKGAWRFIVLDEAHTYSGAKGIEVGFLIRRLKLRLNKHPGELRCIATSATLAEEAQEAVAFARNLFGEDFTTEDIIFGSPDLRSLQHDVREEFTPDARIYLGQAFERLLEVATRADQPATEEFLSNLIDAGLAQVGSALAHGENCASVLHRVLSTNAHISRLRSLMLDRGSDNPLDLREAADYVFTNDEFLPDAAQERIKALFQLVELAALARHGESVLLPSRYHLFARSPQGVWACINPDCQGRTSESALPWSRLFTSPRKVCDACNKAVYPLVVCRTCGQVYLTGFHDGGVLDQEARFDERDGRRFYLWSPPEENAALAEESDGEEVEPSSTSTFTSGQVSLCINEDCRKVTRCSCSQPANVTLYEIQMSRVQRKGKIVEPVTEMTTCFRCHDTARIANSEIATPVKIGGSTPLSVLAMQLYRQLPASDNPVVAVKPGAGRKLLTFYDSRQGAARFAAFLQDVFNQDLYRYMVPEAIKQIAEVDHHSASFLRVSQECIRIGWELLHVFQNDPGAGDFGRTGQLTHVLEDQLKPQVQARMISELTVNRKSRQSLESLGLLAISYFSVPPDVSGLVEKTGLAPQEVIGLAEQLLDTLRSEKAVQLPKGVLPDNPLFGRHKGNPAVVRANASLGEVPWIGATTRNRRFRMVENTLQFAGRPTSESMVRECLEHIWDWITDRGMLGNALDGYRLNLEHVFLSAPSESWFRCARCQRLSHRSAAIPCPVCGGSLQALPQSLDDLLEHNYFRNVLAHDMIPMRVEEHTAQLDPVKGQTYQKWFKDGDINVLSCSTTFEMGIDLGDLQTVVLNNVPPTVANYRQRAGRAGRRVSGTAFIVTWAAERPHDQLYFSEPTTIIRGRVRVPRLHPENPIIRQRHINAILLAKFLVHLAHSGRTNFRKVGDFYDDQTPAGPHAGLLDAWLSACHGELTALISSFLETDSHSEQTPATTIAEFERDLYRERERYRQVFTYLSDQETALAQQRKYQDADFQKKLIDRMRTEPLIDYLSNRQVLPSYSFPLSTVELHLPATNRDHHLRLQRDLRLAITEYATGSEIVADKRLWRSDGLRFYRETPLQFHYRLCGNCNHLVLQTEAGVEISDVVCPTCNEPFRAHASDIYVTPDGFTADARSGSAAGQYVDRPFNTVRSALLLKPDPDMERFGNLVEIGYARNGTLFYVNEGVHSSGFRICLHCGKQAKRADKKCTRCGSENSLKPLVLGHTVTTDTLHISPVSHGNVAAPEGDIVFWNSLLYALLQGASHALQIERADIDGLVFPLGISGGWKSTLVLYDTVAGGAGHVRDIKMHFKEVVREALKVANCPQCEETTSCTHCLRDYNNQNLYPILQRGRIIRYLESLWADLDNQDGDASQSEVVAINRSRWLLREIQSARHTVWIAVDEMPLSAPAGERDSWLDVIHELLRRGVSVNLLTSHTGAPTRERPEQLATYKYLALMSDLRANPLHIYRNWTSLAWPIVIDPAGERCRVVRAKEGFLVLDNRLDQLQLMTSTQPDLVHMAEGSMKANALHSVNAADLAPPASTRVFNIPRMMNKRERDIEAIRSFFASPVASLTIFDPYLLDEARLYTRVSAYIDLAWEGGALEHVTVHTRDAATAGQDRHAQSRAVEKLERKYPNMVTVKRNYDKHDRWIEAVRPDGSYARMLIGRGLDFIRSDGAIEPTWIVVEDPAK